MCSFISTLEKRRTLNLNSFPCQWACKSELPVLLVSAKFGVDYPIITGGSLLNAH